MDKSGIRLQRFLEFEKIEQAKVAKDLGVSQPYISMLCTGKKGIGKKNAVKLQELYGVNAGWLLTGEGEMSQNYAMNEVDEEVYHPAVQIKMIGRPYFDVDFSLGFTILENDQTQNPNYYIDFRPYNHCDLYCNAHGDSMHPTISSGDIVALKRIEDFRYLINGEIYAIVTSNGLRTIKRIHDHGDTFTLISDNPSIIPQSIPKSLVTHVFRVLGTIKSF